MWWIIFFCGLLPTLVTSQKVTSTPMNDIAECKNINPTAEDIVISAPTKTFVLTCQDQNSRKCFCKIPLKIKSFEYKSTKCRKYDAHPDGDCTAFIVCPGKFRYIMICGLGTVFNPEKKSCDHPDNVRCPTQNNISQPPCPLLKVDVGKFPDLESGCKSYYVCQLGIIEKLNCEEGLIFDTWTHRCKDKEKSLCGCNINKPATC